MKINEKIQNSNLKAANILDHLIRFCVNTIELAFQNATDKK
jgi:hypothetical protein